MQILEPFKIIGISIRTSNTAGQASQDLGALWGRFFDEGIGQKIAGKVSEDIYAIYTDYESDYTGDYTCLIGYKVESLEKVQEGLVAREFEGGKYLNYVAKGKMPEAVVNTWQEIWSKDGELNRVYTADFEIYGANSQQGLTSVVDILIAVK